jgi:hypothetical protein
MGDQARELVFASVQENSLMNDEFSLLRYYC